ncbi:MAG TPA: hypothetical protein VFN52_00445, partial [Acidiferrobacteraceae bacterium]|nr:hypothetical protein [Acidiferrobacteraceae bacterium]
MTKKMIVLAAFLAAAGCAHQAVKPGAGGSGGSSAGAGAESSGAGQNGAAGQAMGSSSEQSLSHTVHFAFNSSAVDGRNKAIVKANAQYMLAHPNA